MEKTAGIRVEEASPGASSSRYLVRPLVDPALLQSLRALPIPHPALWRDLVPDLHLVAAGDLVVAAPDPLAAGTPSGNLLRGDNLLETAPGGPWKAAVPGLFLVEGGKAQILGALGEAVVVVDFEARKMAAQGTLLPPEPGFPPFDLAACKGHLEQKGVKKGLREEALRKALEGPHREGKTVRLLLAEGQPPLPGRDARIEYLVETGDGPAPAEDEKGQVDFRKTTLVKGVDAGQPLARKHPPTKGLAGHDVTGMILPSVDGRDLRPVFGQGVEPSSGDPDLFVARHAGSLRLRRGVLDVEEVFRLDGDVDYSSGNVLYEKTVFVTGDVKAGFAVEAGGDLEVGGLAEECRLRVGGSAVLHGGFLGHGAGVLEAGAAVSVGFVGNQTVRALGRIQVQKEALNSHLFSRESIAVGASIAGGKAMALSQIHCLEAGNELGLPTELHVGLDYVLVDARTRLEAGVTELTALQQKLFRNSHRLDRVQAEKGFLGDEDKGLLLALRLKQEEISRKLEDMNAKLVKIGQSLKEQLLRPEGWLVKVERKVWAGTVIRMGQEALRLQEDLPGPRTFAYREGTLKVY